MELVCCCRSVISHWTSEFARFSPDLKVVTYHGNQDERSAAWQVCFLKHVWSGKGRLYAEAAGANSAIACLHRIEGCWHVFASHRMFASRVQASRRNFHVLLTTYELLLRDAPRLSATRWYYVILDEGHRIKNGECRLSHILRGYKTQHKLLLTGTPVQNKLAELWSLLNFLVGTAWLVIVLAAECIWALAWP